MKSNLLDLCDRALQADDISYKKSEMTEEEDEDLEFRFKVKFL